MKSMSLSDCALMGETFLSVGEHSPLSRRAGPRWVDVFSCLMIQISGDQLAAAMAAPVVLSQQKTLFDQTENDSKRVWMHQRSSNPSPQLGRSSFDAVEHFKSGRLSLLWNIWCGRRKPSRCHPLLDKRSLWESWPPCGLHASTCEYMRLQTCVHMTTYVCSDDCGSCSTEVLYGSERLWDK